MQLDDLVRFCGTLSRLEMTNLIALASLNGPAALAEMRIAAARVGRPDAERYLQAAILFRGLFDGEKEEVPRARWSGEAAQSVVVPEGEAAP